MRQDYDLSATGILRETEDLHGKIVNILNTPLAMTSPNLDKGANNTVYIDESTDAAARND
jgi:phage baseplate assembly protein W